MGTGLLKFEIHTGDDALPIEGARVTVYSPDGRVIYKTVTDKNGNTPAIRLTAPDIGLTLDPNYNRPAYALCNSDIEAEGYVTKHISSIPIVDTQTTIMRENMQPLVDDGQNITDEYIDIPMPGVLQPTENHQAEPPPPVVQEGEAIPAVADVSDPPSTVIAGRGVLIPDYITVHLGTPQNSSARNVRVRFSDYIKNVVSSEIYSTWPLNSLKANINVIVTFALNRVYTEWYRSRGYVFDITNSTGYDMAYRDGGPVFQNISELVDEMFSTYARRIGFENPYFTQFCNGTTSTCDGLSQWGTVTLANQGKAPLEILRYYYPDDLELTYTGNIGGITASYPGYPLRTGSSGEPVRRIQNYLNRIRVNYPLIPEISNPNGVFGEDTASAVRAFQRTFNMTADGIVGAATWNKIMFIFVAVTRLAELNGEGIRVSIGQNPPSSTLTTGSRGNDVAELQFLLNYISVFFPSVPTVIQNSLFDTRTKNSVIEFQKTFGLPSDGIVGTATWNELYAVYKGIDDSVNPPIEPPETPETPAALPYPGTPLRPGSTGRDVATMQAFLNVINAVYPTIPKLIADGIFGAATENAVRIFQQNLFLPVDGVIGEATWNKIVEVYQRAVGNESAELEYPGAPLSTGSTGTPVRLIQRMLYELRQAYPELPDVAVDGVFSAQTEAAVIAFQRMFGLSPDGIIGPVTWYAIIEERLAAI